MLNLWLECDIQRKKRLSSQNVFTYAMSQAEPYVFALRVYFHVTPPHDGSNDRDRSGLGVSDITASSLRLYITLIGVETISGIIYIRSLI